MWQEKITQTHTFALNTHHLEVISRHLQQLWPELSCVVVGRRRNAGRAALRSPTEGKLQGPHCPITQQRLLWSLRPAAASNPLMFDISEPTGSIYKCVCVCLLWEQPSATDSMEETISAVSTICSIIHLKPNISPHVPLQFNVIGFL